MTTWVLEHGVFSDGDQALAAAVREADGRVIAWNDDWWLDGRWPKRTGEALAFHGSLANADRVARELPWRPGAMCSSHRFTCSAWWPSMADDLVTSEFAFMTAAGLANDGPPREFGDQLFVRPDSPLKPFSGRVLERDQINLAALDHGFYYADEELPVVVAPAVEIGAEWRFVAAAGKIIAGSEYLPAGRSPGLPITRQHESWRYAADIVLDLGHPDPLFVVDVCETPAGLRLLEMNPFSGADLYSCDRSSIVAAVHSLTA